MRFKENARWDLDIVSWDVRRGGMELFWAGGKFGDWAGIVPGVLDLLHPFLDLREYCDKNYNQLLPIIAEKFNQKKERNEKLKEVKAGLNFEERSETSQKITQSFSPNTKILFPPLKEEEGTKGPMIIEAEIKGHCTHHMYVDGRSASEILYEHCYNRLRSKIKRQLVPATTPLIGFSDEVIWPIGQIQLLVRIGDEEHSASAWMNFLVVRSSSPYNGIIRRPRVRKLQAVLSTAHRMLKLPVEGGVITLKGSRLVPLECALVSRPEKTLLTTKPLLEERVKVAINLEYLEQAVMIGFTLTEEGRNKLCDAYKGYHQIQMAKKMKKKQHSLQTKGYSSIQRYLSEGYAIPQTHKRWDGDFEPKILGKIKRVVEVLIVGYEDVVMNCGSAGN
nr:reverse transcriptase domain-containing protein [Tanacetum cinerariifolium]